MNTANTKQHRKLAECKKLYGFHLLSKTCSHCTWLVLSHFAEYHFKALTTTSLSHTDHTLCLSILAFQMSYAQRHIAHSSKHPSLAVGPVIVIYHFQLCSGVERSSVSPMAALKILILEVNASVKDLRLNAKAKDLATEVKAKAKAENFSFKAKAKVEDFSFKAKAKAKAMPQCP